MKQLEKNFPHVSVIIPVFNGEETITITVTDGDIQAQEDIDVTVTAVNDAPVSIDNPEAYTTTEEILLDIALLRC